MLAGAARPEGPERLPALRPAASGRRTLTALLVVLLLGTAFAIGCGGDDESSAEAPPPLPELTVPESDREPVPAPEPAEPAPEPAEPAPAPEEEAVPEPEAEELQPEPESVPPPATDGGTPAPEPEPPADSPENDLPPPPNSPAERFEDFCNENPGACG
jgi:outer membrane biosynthesis protein TonB